MEYDVFISHSSKDVETVKSLCLYLEDKGLRCFVSYRDIHAGENYPSAITRAMRESEMLLLVLSNNSRISDQVDQEISMANELKKRRACFRLENVNYSDCAFYAMNNINWLDAFPEPEKHYFKLYHDLCHLLGREPKEEQTKGDREEGHSEKLYSSKGNNDAQYDVGRAFENGGFGGNVDYEEAIRGTLEASKSVTDNPKVIGPLAEVDKWLGRYKENMEQWKEQMDETKNKIEKLFKKLMK